MVEPKVSRFYVTVIIEWVNVAVHTVIPGGAAKTRGGSNWGLAYTMPWSDWCVHECIEPSLIRIQESSPLCHEIVVLFLC